MAMSDIDHTINSLSHSLGAATRILTVIARLDDDHGLQPELNHALHHVLIVAEEGRQALQERQAKPKRHTTSGSDAAEDDD